jgi:hypothetical protein
MRTSEAPLPSTALKHSSDHFVVSDLYRVTVPRLYRTLYTHSGSHRLWSVCPSHDFLARRMAVSEAASMRYSACELRRIRRATRALFCLRKPRPAPRSKERKPLYSPLGGPRSRLDVLEVATLRVYARPPGGKGNLRAYGPGHEATPRGVLRAPQRASLRPAEH